MTDKASYPQWLPVLVENVPVQLRDMPHWLTWRAIMVNGRAEKRPFNAATNRQASPNKPSTWSPFMAAVAAYQKGGYDGIGIALVKNGGLVGIDIDKCRNPVTGALNAIATDILARLNNCTYVEVSPSGTGLRIFLKGTACNRNNRKQQIEIYDGGSSRYLTVTGHKLESAAATIAADQPFIDYLVATYFTAKAAESPQGEPAEPPTYPPLDDEEVLRLARSQPDAAKRERFTALFDRGDTSKYAGNYSNADMALADDLAYWCRRNIEQMDRLFRQSKLMRSKWDEPHYQDGATYGEHTIQKAADECEQIYLTKDEQTAANAPTSPEPLHRPITAAAAYPVDTLPATLRDAVHALHTSIQAPAALCAQSILATAALVSQPHCDVIIDGRVYPISLFFISIAESGERKSAVDNAVHQEVDAWQRELVDRYREDCNVHRLALMEYEMLTRDAVKGKVVEQQKAKPTDGPDTKERREQRQQVKKDALAALGAPPDPPLLPNLKTASPTSEGLYKALDTGQPSMGLFSDEGALFIGGHALKHDAKMRTLGTLTKLWDGKPLDRVRAGEGAAMLFDKRLSLHLMMQPMIATEILSDGVVDGQGLFSRTLFAWPTSAMGNRKYSAMNLSRDPAMTAFWLKTRALLERPMPIRAGTLNELQPRLLPLSTGAYPLWVQYADQIESLLAEGQVLYPIRGIGNKAAELVARLAAVMTVFENPDAARIEVTEVQTAIELMDFHLTEALRIKQGSGLPPDLQKAAQLSLWAQQFDVIYPAQVYRLGPYSLRTKPEAMQAISILEQHGHLKKIPGGMEVDGARRKEVWRVVKGGGS